MNNLLPLPVLLPLLGAGLALAVVDVRGTGFGASTSSLSVSIGGTDAPIRSVAPNHVVVTVPVGAPSGELRVSRGGASSAGALSPASSNQKKP